MDNNARRSEQMPVAPTGSVKHMVFEEYKGGMMTSGTHKLFYGRVDNATANDIIEDGAVTLTELDDGTLVAAWESQNGE